ncbi:Crp/Fnr family transcriptional regulator [soil metagenome]
MAPPEFDHAIALALVANPLLSLLSESQRERFAAAASLIDYAKGDTLYRAGDPAREAWAVVSGQIKIVNRGRSGHELIIELIVPAEICGALCYSCEGNFLFAAHALEETRALRFPIGLLEEIARSNSRLSQELLRDTCRRLYHAQHMRSISGEDVAGRVACALVYLQDKFGNEIPHTRRTLAELAGTSVESAIRATKALSNKGILETRRGHIVIKSANRLKKTAHHRG